MASKHGLVLPYGLLHLSVCSFIRYQLVPIVLSIGSHSYLMHEKTNKKNKLTKLVARDINFEVRMIILVWVTEL